MTEELRPGEKRHISPEEAKARLLELIQQISGTEKLEQFFMNYYIPQSIMEDPEVQKEVAETLQILGEVEEHGPIVSALSRKKIDLLNRLFKRG